MSTASDLLRLMNQAFEMGFEYNCFSTSGSDHWVILSKQSASRSKVTVEGRGRTPAEAWARAFANFPESPLDKSVWVNPRLSYAPTAAADGIPF